MILCHGFVEFGLMICLGIFLDSYTYMCRSVGMHQGMYAAELN